jgi:hypothetical protein
MPPPAKLINRLNEVWKKRKPGNLDSDDVITESGSSVSESEEMQKVKKHLNEAAKTLDKVMSQAPRTLEALEMSKLQNLPDTNDLEKIASELEVAIDDIVKAWESTTAEKDKALWKGWFNLVFPYVETSINVKQVRKLVWLFS